MERAWSTILSQDPDVRHGLQMEALILSVAMSKAAVRDVVPWRT
jgi:hypothetical protein